MNEMEFLGYLSEGGVVGILVFIVVTGARRWWVFGWMYDQAITERNEWKRVALKGTRLLESAAERQSNGNNDESA